MSQQLRPIKFISDADETTSKSVLVSISYHNIEYFVSIPNPIIQWTAELSFFVSRLEIEPESRDIRTAKQL